MADKVTTLEVAGKKYKIPSVTVKIFRKAVLAITFEKPLEMNTDEYLDNVMEFYHLLLKGTYPELTKAKLEDMPAYQTGLEFITVVKIAAMQRPLDSNPKPKEKKTPSKIS